MLRRRESDRLRERKEVFFFLFFLSDRGSRTVGEVEGMKRNYHLKLRSICQDRGVGVRPGVAVSGYDCSQPITADSERV